MRTALLFGVLPTFLAACLIIGVTAAPRSDVGATARSQQWPLDALGIEDAWRQTRGTGITVAVLDTGVNGRHPDLEGSVVQGPDFTGAGDKATGRHGTAMAGLIVGHGSGRPVGVLGVAPEARILSIRVTLENDDPRRRNREVDARCRTALAKGIRYAVRHGARVISMSLGGGSGAYEGSKAEEEAVRYARMRGVVLVASSGNDGAGANRRNFPAAYPGVISVGAVDRDLRRAAFSNRQPYLSLAAPGAAIFSTEGPDSYVVGDGTSSAAAFVAGIAALIRSRYPNLSARQVQRALLLGTVRRPAGGRDDAYGNGVANAPLALAAAGRLARTAARKVVTDVPDMTNTERASWDIVQPLLPQSDLLQDVRRIPIGHVSIGNS